MTAKEELIDILERTKQALALPNNDFSWSGWENYAAAEAEIDGLLAKIRADQPVDPLDIEVLFVVTGPVQEVSLSSGWGSRFLEFATHADAAITRYFEKR